MTSNHHAPYVLGYTRATMGITTGSKLATASKTLKSTRCSDCRLRLACIKFEVLVIANQHVAVDSFPGLGRTARHSMGVGSTLSQ